MLKRLELKNVGPSDSLEIDFAPRVNLITGDNGLGKSFVLDLAWWALTRTWAHYPARPTNGKEATIAYTYDSANKEVTHTSSFSREAQEWRGKRGRPGLPGMVLYAQVDGSFSVFDPARNYWKTVPDRPPAYLFSPSEVWDGLSRRDSKDPSRTESLCEGLIRDWASWQGQNGTAFDQLKSVLKKLSPAPAESLVPGDLTRISLGDVRDMPTLKMTYGADVAVVHASAAIRRVAALAYLLVWTWQEHKKASKLLGGETTNEIIFLIDEVEAHLHPAWQRRILRALMDVVAALAESDQVKVQIIAVTHSPMLLASMEPVFDPEKDALWIFDLEEVDQHRHVQLRRDDWHRRGDASAWLQSDIFDLGEARSVEAEEALTAARAFMQRNIAEPAEFQRLYELLRAAMPGDDPFWVTWRGWAWRHGLLDEKTP